MKYSSGLASCALEERQGSALWQTIATACSGSTARSAEPGRLYTFRLTASDLAGNSASTQAQNGVERVIKYYAFGAARVAMRTNGTVYPGLPWAQPRAGYLHSDHLGSTSLVTAGTTNGGVVARQLYSPYGQARPGGAGTLPTDFTFIPVPGTGRPANGQHRADVLPRALLRPSAGQVYLGGYNCARRSR